MFSIYDLNITHVNWHISVHFSADFTPIAYRAPDQARAPKEVPPYNGFGSEEDSLCSTKYVTLTLIGSYLIQSAPMTVITYTRGFVNINSSRTPL